MSTGPTYVHMPPMNSGVGQIIIGVLQIVNGLLLMLVAFLGLANIDKNTKIMQRADQIIESHEDDVLHFTNTARSRNQMLRLIGEKIGVDAAEMDEAFGLDTLAAHKPKARRRRMVAP